nr:unnamed protein product [Digitaria exilis]
MATVDAESGKAAAAAAEPVPPVSGGGFSGADVALRALLFAVTLAGLVVLATAKQTVLFPVPLLGVVVPMPAKFKDSPAFILLTAVGKLVSGSSASTAKNIFLLLLLDVLYAAVMASATGSAGGVAWIGLKGNSHTRWNKICDAYGNFCRHIGSSVFLSLIASIILVLLAAINAHSLYRRTR